MKNIHTTHQKEIKNIVQLYGMTGIVAILSEWAKNEGGFKFIKNVVRDMDESFIQGFSFESERYNNDSSNVVVSPNKRT